ncbi:Oidioi.mRNA.OKI2018_I69.XSR.g16507.t1.cds [Oikopleura dioica]|uniref:Oidioi.mRNA.OKI2018_I69.XSR.g16507.t1.cds n=1 Tax=Oikopleura dioica TaxID=34765 RepID=A0ABN7SGB9_OIKDI|nr:Oidioi.mRNA.OKI2018_I69.XSR.g16507.t1.cds [Oikopleura dioica]
MKLSAAFFALASADICGDCDAHIADFNAWHGQSNIVCSRYQHPRDLFVDARAACKECKVQCVPNEETCPGTDDLAAGFWNKTALKLQEQYIKRAESKAAAQVAARLALRSSNKLQKEQDKYNKMKQKMEEKQAKAENKAAKKEDYAKWREEKRAENEARRAAAKQAKKEAKAAAKAAKEEAKRKRLEKRALAEKNKVLFAFYADLEEHYDPLCPDMFLIQDNEVEARKYANWKRAQTFQ